MPNLSDEFPLDPGLCYLNHAAIGPWPQRTATAVATLAQQLARRGGSDYPTWLAVESRLRERIARLINAPSGADIALVKNTSEGLSIISQGIDWQEGDEVIGVRGDFCSNEMVWEVLRDRGVEYNAIDIADSDAPETRLLDAITPRTRLMAISSVHFATGYRFDVARIADACAARGVLLSIDAIQSLGAIEFDLNRVSADFVVAGGHKWLMSAEGLGFLYCRPALRDTLSLHQFGWAMRASPYAFETRAWQPADNARRFESGTPNMLGIHAMDATLSLIEEVGIADIERRLAANIDSLRAALGDHPRVEFVTPQDRRKRAGILTFRVDDANASELHTKLMDDGVICSPRAGGIRLSPHFYTTLDALERAVQKIRKHI